MEKQVWKVGIASSTVVSDTKIKNTNFPSPPNREESDEDEIEFYGGYLICESVGNVETAKLIAAAPEMFEALIQWQAANALGNAELLHDARILREIAIKKATE